MAFQTTVRVPTANASRYLQQLCKHWAHTLAVEFDEQTGAVTFPRNSRGADWPSDAFLTLQADDNGLDCRLMAGAEAQLQALQGAPAPPPAPFPFRPAPLRLPRGAAQLRLAGSPSLKRSPRLAQMSIMILTKMLSRAGRSHEYWSMDSRGSQGAAE